MRGGGGASAQRVQDRGDVVSEEKSEPPPHKVDAIRSAVSCPLGIQDRALKKVDISCKLRPQK